MTSTPAHQFNALPASGPLSSSTGLPPVLLSATPAGVADSMRIDLNFSTAMAAGSGSILVTDGAVETVIDRVTGQPAMRVVGATDTHTLSASQLAIDGSHVTLNVAGLLPGHSYSVVMGPGVLVSSEHLAFGGVRSTSQLQFSTPPAPDTSAPALVSIDAGGSVLKAGSSIALTLAFSEALKSLAADALSAPNASITGLASSDGGITWHATLTAPSDALTAPSNLLTLDMSRVQDLAGNAGSGSAQLASYAVDTEAPTARIELDHTTASSTQAIVATLRFSEAVKSLDPDALSAGHASISNLHTTDGGHTWQATLSGADATTAGANVLSLDMSRVVDLAGNAGQGVLHSDSYAVDTQGPSGVAIALDSAVLKNGGTTGVRFTFSEAVKDFGAAAITAPHADISALATQDGGLTWTAQLSATGTGAWSGNVVGVDLSKLVDLAGNAGSGSVASAAYAVDTVAPLLSSVKLDGATVGATAGLGVTLTFSEAIKSLDPSAISTPHATLAGLHTLDDGTTWAATLSAAAGGDSSGNQLGIDMSRVLDLAGNMGSGNGSAQLASYAVDTQGPGASLALSGGVLNADGSLQLTIRFSEAVSDLNAAAVEAPNAVLGQLRHSADNLTWSATLSPTAGAVSAATNAVSLDLGQVHDAAGNAGSGTAASSNYAVDTTPPQGVAITLGAAALDAADSMRVSFSFKEAIAALPLDAIDAPGAVVSGLASLDGGLSWTGSLRAAPGVTLGASQVQVDLGKLHDLAGNAGSGLLSSSASYTVDSQAPQVAAIVLAGSDITPTDGIGFTIRFTEAVRDFSAAAIGAPHASIDALASLDEGLTWTGTLKALDALANPGNVLSVDLGKLHDAAGNAGSGSVASTAFYNTNPAGLQAAVSLSGTALPSGGSLQATIRFTNPVDSLDASAFDAPHANVTDLKHSDDKLTWTATLSPHDLDIYDTHATFSVDLSKVSDHSGKHGSGLASAPAYVYDTTVGAYLTEIGLHDTGVSGNDGVTRTNQVWVDFESALPLDRAHQHIAFTIDNGTAYDVWLPQDSDAPPGFRSETMLGDGPHTLTAWVVDDQNHTSAALVRTFTVDTSAPEAQAPATSENFDASGDLVLRFSEPVYWTDGGNNVGGLLIHNDEDGDTHAFDRNIGLSDTHFSADHKTLTIKPGELQLASGNDYTLTLPETLTDLAGNGVSDAVISLHVAGPHVDATAPSAIEAAVQAAATGTFGPGARIEIGLRFNEAVTLVGSGMPALALNNGAEAGFSRFSDDHKTMVFTYTVSGADTSIDRLDLVNTTDLVGHVADLSGNLLDQAHVSYTGLQSADGQACAIRIDTHADAPAAPQLAATSDTGALGDGVTSVVLPDIVGHGAEAKATVNLYAGELLLGQAQADDKGDWHIDDVQLDHGGSYALSARQTDQAGNVSAFSQALNLTIQPAAPAVATLAAGDDSGAPGDNLTQVKQPTFSGKVDAGTRVDLWDGGTLLGSAAVAGDGNWTFKPAAALAEGEHLITLQLTDANGNLTPRGLSTPLDLRIDATAPNAPGAPALAAGSDSGSSQTDNITKVAKPTLTGSAFEAGGTVEVYDGGALLGSAAVGADKSWSFTIGSQADHPDALSDGLHALSVVQVDAAGNRSAVSAALAVTIDTVAPTILASTSLTRDGGNWFDLSFSEPIVFGTNGAIDVLDAANSQRSQHTWNVMTNWDLVTDSHGVRSVLELNLGTLFGAYHLQTENNAIQDVAGNVAIIGNPHFTVGLA